MIKILDLMQAFLIHPGKKKMIQKDTVVLQ